MVFSKKMKKRHWNERPQIKCNVVDRQDSQLLLLLLLLLHCSVELNQCYSFQKHKILHFIALQIVWYGALMCCKEFFGYTQNASALGFSNITIFNTNSRVDIHFCNLINIYWLQWLVQIQWTIFLICKLYESECMCVSVLLSIWTCLST